MEKTSSPTKLISWMDYSLFHANDLNWIKGSIAIGLSIHGLALRGMVEFVQPSGFLYVLVHCGQAVGALLAIMVLASPVFEETVNCWREKRASVEVGLLAGVLILLFTSLTASLRVRPWSYYEVIPVVLTIYAVSRYWLSRKVRKVAASFPIPFDRAERCNRVEPNGSVSRMPLADIKVGDEIKISSSQMVPVDGVVVTGEGYVSEASLNGSKFPRVKQPGDPILAGSVSLDGIFTLKTLSPYVARKLQPTNNPLLHTAFENTLQRSYRKSGNLAALIVCLLGTTGFVVNWLNSGFYLGLITAATILILGATLTWVSGVPVHFWTALVHLARRGLYGKRPSLVYDLATANTAIFGKTGVLTRDQLELSRFFVMPAFQDREDWIKSLVYQASRMVYHPLTNSLVGVGTHIRGEPVVEDLAYTVLPGRGIEVTLTDGLGDVLTLRIGESPFILRKGAKARLSGILEEHDLLDGKRIWISLEGRLCAIALLKEDWNVPPQPFFAQLEFLGIQSTILTGDKAFNDFRLTGLDCKQGLSAKEKQRIVETAVENNRKIVYVGDGLNDYRAMASAAVPVAMNHAPDVLINSAAAVLSSGNLHMLTFGIQYARRIVTLSRKNKWAYLALTTIGSFVAIAGWLNPMLATLVFLLGFFAVLFQEIILRKSILSKEPKKPRKSSRTLEAEELFAPNR